MDSLLLHETREALDTALDERYRSCQASTPESRAFFLTSWQKLFVTNKQSCYGYIEMSILRTKDLLIDKRLREKSLRISYFNYKSEIHERERNWSLNHLCSKRSETDYMILSLILLWLFIIIKTHDSESRGLSCYNRSPRNWPLPDHPWKLQLVPRTICSTADGPLGPTMAPWLVPLCHSCSP